MALKVHPSLIHIYISIHQPQRNEYSCLELPDTSHLIYAHAFPPTFKTHDLKQLFMAQYPNVYVHWLNDTSCLLSFPRDVLADPSLTIANTEAVTKTDTETDVSKEEGEIEEAVPTPSYLLLRRLQEVPCRTHGSQRHGIDVCVCM